MSYFFKGIAILFAILCLWAAFLQWNDPDALLWYLIYGSGFLASAFFLFDRLPSVAAFAISVLYLIGSVYLWPERYEGLTIGAGNIDNIEKGRESFGVLILAVVMLVYGLRVKYKSSS